MKSNKLTCLIGFALLASGAVQSQVAAQVQTDNNGKPEHHRYKLVDLGTFGGPASEMNPAGNGSPYINIGGTAVGTSATFVPSSPASNGFFCNGLDGTVPFVFHAFEWRDGGVSDLGALPPVVNNCSSALSVNDNGEIAGGSENGLIDTSLGVKEIRAVLWRDGRIKDLGTFGGNFSTATSINSRGQVVGFSLNAISEPLSMFAVVLGGPSAGTQTRAFLWEKGEMNDLGTLGGPDAWATFVNEHCQIAGYSYTNSTPNAGTGFPTTDPFLWKNGKMMDLGTLGGTFGKPSALNNRGLVIGQSNIAGDQASDPFLWDGQKLIDLFTSTSGGNPFTANAINDSGEVVGAAAFPNVPAFHAYLWRNGAATDLGTISEDDCSEAFGINASAQVVGQSFACDGSVVHTFLWENGSIVDLNALIPSNSSLQLVEAVAINHRGEIAGDGLPPGCGIAAGDAQCGHAFVLIPCDEGAKDSEGCRDADAATRIVDENRVATPSPQTAATQPSLTPSETRERIRILLANRHRRFRFWPRE